MFYTHVFTYSSLFLWQRGRDIRIKCWHLSFPYMIWCFCLWSSQLCSGVHCSWLWNLDEHRATKEVVSGISAIKSYWKSRAASNSSCIFLERDPSLWRATNSCNQSWASQTDSYKTMSASYHVYLRQLWTLVKWPQKGLTGSTQQNLNTCDNWTGSFHFTNFSTPQLLFLCKHCPNEPFTVHIVLHHPITERLYVM